MTNKVPNLMKKRPFFIKNAQIRIRLNYQQTLYFYQSIKSQIMNYLLSFFKFHEDLHIHQLLQSLIPAKRIVVKMQSIQFIWNRIAIINQLYLTSSMKQPARKDSGHLATGNHQQGSKPRKKVMNVKTVEIFMNNLDRQIHESYGKLKRNQGKITSGNKDSKSLEQTMACAAFSTLHITQQSNLCVSISPSPNRKTSQSCLDQSQFVMLDNKEVMEYIHMVYDLYNIKDPLTQAEKVEPERYSTNKKIRAFKDNFQREIGSASTMKQSYMYKSIQLNPFQEERKPPNKKQSTSAAKIQVVSLVSKNQSRNSSNQKLEESKDKQSTFRFKNRNVLQKKQKINITATHRIQAQANNAVASIPQLFRFCFMCEQPILQCNLESHEKICEPLQKAFSYSLQELLQIIDRKIGHLVDEINRHLIEKTEERIKEEFKAIKSSVRNWLTLLPSEALVQSKSHSGSNKLLNRNWRGQFNKIEQTISSSVCSSFHLIHKLQWFSKLRENIGIKFYASQ